MKKITYQTPTLKVVAFKTEMGFALSASPFKFDSDLLFFDDNNQLEEVSGETWNNFWTE